MSYPLVFVYVLGAQTNRLIETVLLNTHNICFSLEIRISFFGTHSELKAWVYKSKQFKHSITERLNHYALCYAVNKLEITIPLARAIWELLEDKGALGARGTNVQIPTSGHCLNFLLYYWLTTGLYPAILG